MPMASPRSRAGNHSETVLGDAVQLPASPNPSAKRNPASEKAERASAVSTLASDHQPTNSARLMREPSLSTMTPEASSAMV